MNMIGMYAQKRGALAEQRVKEIAKDLGLDIYYLEQLDFGGKVDLTIAGVKVQISCKPKSVQAIRALKRKGIHCIIAGEEVKDESIRLQIQALFNQEL